MKLLMHVYDGRHAQALGKLVTAHAELVRTSVARMEKSDQRSQKHDKERT